jgi:tetratricopeptide (TPR) repeat protein
MAKKIDETETMQRAVESVNKNEYDEAILQLKDLLAAHPKHELGLGMLASIYAELKMTDRAIEHYQRLLAINPTNPLACLQLGMLQAAAQRPREVLDTWKARLGEPDEYLAHYFTGLALLSLEKTQEAREMLERAATNMPKDYALYEPLQQMLKELGN